MRPVEKCCEEEKIVEDRDDGKFWCINCGTIDQSRRRFLQEAGCPINFWRKITKGEQTRIFEPKAGTECSPRGNIPTNKRR